MSRTTVASERRTKQRKRPSSLIYVELGSSNGGMMRDLSEKGFAMRVMIPLRAGESTVFAFSLDSSTRLEGTCRVLWVEEGGRVAGLQFTELSPDLRTLVRAWLEEQQDQTLKTMSAPNSEPPVSTLQQLREEIRSIPARPEIPEIEAMVISAAEPSTQATSELPEAPPVSTLQRLRDELRSAPARRELQQPGLQQIEATVIPSPEPKIQTVAESPAAKSISVPVVEAGLPEAVNAPMETREPIATHALPRIPVLPDVELPSELLKSRPGAERSLVSLGVRMMLLFALLAVAVVFHQEVGNAVVWLGTKIAGASPAEISPISQNDNPLPAQPAPSTTSPSTSVPSATAPSGSGSAQTVSGTEQKDESVAPSKNNEDTSATPESNFTPPAKTPAPVSPGSVLPVTRSTTPSQAVGVPGVEPGQAEYLAAQDLLKKNADAELPEAVKLLWTAVEKGNANAEVTLAELYRQGRGVAKNCDQTNILLSAAARKGNALAQRLLREFQGESCE